MNARGRPRGKKSSNQRNNATDQTTVSEHRASASEHRASASAISQNESVIAPIEASILQSSREASTLHAPEHAEAPISSNESNLVSTLSDLSTIVAIKREDNSDKDTNAASAIEIANITKQKNYYPLLISFCYASAIISGIIIAKTIISIILPIIVCSLCCYIIRYMKINQNELRHDCSVFNADQMQSNPHEIQLYSHQIPPIDADRSE